MQPGISIPTFGIILFFKKIAFHYHYNYAKFLVGMLMDDGCAPNFLKLCVALRRGAYADENGYLISI